MKEETSINIVEVKVRRPEQLPALILYTDDTDVMPASTLVGGSSYLDPLFSPLSSSQSF